MYKDEIIAEVWRNRDTYARAHHYSLREMVNDLRRREHEHPQRVVDRSVQRQAQVRAKRVGHSRPRAPKFTGA